MMQNKLTKTKTSKFDKFCKKLRVFSISLVTLSFIAFIPINAKLKANKNVLDAEIMALKEEQNEIIAYKEQTTDVKTKIAHIKIKMR